VKRSSTPSNSLPVIGLLALAAAGFLTILTEALPAGLLPDISAGLGVTESMAGQLITAYAAGSLAAAIPLTAATRSWRRRPLLLTAVGGFLFANAFTALSDSYVLTLGARFIAGVFAGLVWALLAGYAGRMAPNHLKGRAIALAMLGTPLALSIGIPAGTMVSGLIGWRAVFLMMSGLSLLLVAWIIWRVPDFEGESAAQRTPLLKVLQIRGLRPVLVATFGFVLAHNILYTYIVPVLRQAGLVDRTDLVLLLFGVAALVSIWFVAVWIDSRLMALTMASTGLFLVAGLLLAAFGQVTGMVLPMIAVWGLAFGGAASLFQTASARVAGRDTDLAQSMIVTVWNLAIAGGGLLGGVIVLAGADVLSWSAAFLLTVTGCVIFLNRRVSFR
jgi:predicted MFS family arabinose efflux permease